MSSDKHFEHTVNLARDALKSLLIVNGGGATALIALMQKDASHDFTSAVILLAAATVATVVAYCLAYFSQLNYANGQLALEGEDARNAVQYHNWHCKLQAVTIVVLTITLALMVSGMVTAARIASQQ
jgi:amino acid transporter